MNCVVCKRVLKNPKYIAIQMGPVCAKKNNRVSARQESLFPEDEERSERLFPEMSNRRMAEKLADGRAIDLSQCQRTAEGDYLIPDFDEDGDFDYCDRVTENWIWSIGKFPDGRVVASTSGKFYQNPNCKCVWLR